MCGYVFHVREVKQAGSGPIGKTNLHTALALSHHSSINQPTPGRRRNPPRRPQPAQRRHRGPRQKRPRRLRQQAQAEHAAQHPDHEQPPPSRHRARHCCCCAAVSPFSCPASSCCDGGKGGVHVQARVVISVSEIVCWVLGGDLTSHPAPEPNPAAPTPS